MGRGAEASASSERAARIQGFVAGPLPVLLAIGGIAGCADGPVVPVDAEPVYRAVGLTVEEGVLTASFEIENPGTLPIQFRIHFGCHGTFILELFEVGDESGVALWSEAGLPLPPGGCKMPPFFTDLEPGEILEVVDEFAADVILGDSIPPGTYEIRATVRQREPVARDISLTVGEADIGA